MVLTHYENSWGDQILSTLTLSNVQGMDPSRHLAMFTHDPTQEQPISPGLGDTHPDTWHRSHQCCWCSMACSAPLCSHSHEEWNAIIQRKLCWRVTSDANGSIVLLHRTTTISLLLALHGNWKMRLRGMLATVWDFCRGVRMRRQLLLFYCLIVLYVNYLTQSFG